MAGGGSLGSRAGPDAAGSATAKAARLLASHLGAGAAGLRSWVGANVAGERERWPLWLPVGLGLGIALYFSLPLEPAAWLGPAAALAGLAVFLATTRAGAAAGRVRSALVLGGLAAALIGAGFTVAQLRTLWVAAPVLEKRIGPATVRGRIAYVEDLPRGRRLVLEMLSIPTLEAAATPARARIRVNRGAPGLGAGEWVAVRAVVRPPPGPAAPGAFDFQRHAFFQRIGAVGYALGPVRRSLPPAAGEGEGGSGIAAGAAEQGDLPGPGTAKAPGAGKVTAAGKAEGAALRWRLWLSELRHEIGARVRAALGPVQGAVAAALMTGERGAIPERVMAAMRDSGLAHLLAISGLHIGLVAGILFFSLRGLLALVPAVALRVPIKKWAALAALVGAFAYLVVTGATVPTRRAFVMAAIALLAVLADRTAISMRIVAWAAVIVLALNPESLLGASFQMSFAAVVALVAVYERVAGAAAGGGLAPLWRVAGDQGPWWRRRLIVYMAGVALTTIVASLATAPFAVYQFNRFAAYGLAANLVAVPVTALWIMPWAMAAFALMPFGLEAVALAPMGWGIAVVIAVAEGVSAWPGAASLVPAMPPAGIALVALGGLWLCLWRRRWRYLGLVAVAAGLLWSTLGRPPDVLVDGDAKLMAVRGEDGALLLSSARAARFRAGIWLRRAGQGEAETWPREGTAALAALSCDGLGCIYRARGQTVALVRDGRALAEDCRIASVVVSLVPVRAPCPAGRVIDRFDLWRAGGHALWLDPDGVRVETVRARQGKRPWVPLRER